MGIEEERARRSRARALAAQVRAVSVEQFTDDEDPPKLRWRAEFRRG